MFSVNTCDGKYHNSLDVRFTKACDNACAFCIEGDGLKALPQDVDEMIRNTLTSGKSTVLILGGEPLLNLDKVLKYVKGIRSGVKEIFITTSLPKSCADNPKINELLSIIDGLNVSLCHYDTLTNNKLLSASSNHCRIFILSSLLEKWSDKIRVSVNLMKSGIDSKEKLSACINNLISLGANKIKLNELQGADGLYVSFENSFGIKLRSPFAFGCQTDVSNLFDVNSGTVLLKRSCFVVNKNLQASLWDVIKLATKAFKVNTKSTTLVMYENGKISNGWK